jgi:hypothetical protein
MYQININVGVDFCEQPGDPKIRNSSVEEFFDTHFNQAWNSLLCFDGESKLVLDFSRVVDNRHSRTFVQRFFYLLFQNLNCSVKTLNKINQFLHVICNQELLADHWCNVYFNEACKRLTSGDYQATPVKHQKCKAYQRVSLKPEPHLSFL